MSPSNRVDRKQWAGGILQLEPAQIQPVRRALVAVEAIGGSPAYNMVFAVLPNAWSPILVQIVVLASVAILPGLALTLTILLLDALGHTLGAVLDAPQEMAAACIRGEA